MTANGKVGTPNSRMAGLMMPRAAPPVNSVVSAVWHAARICSAARWMVLMMVDLGHSKYAVLTCTPATMTGTRTAYAINDGSANVPRP